MKIAIIMLLTTVTMVSAKSYSQNVTLNMKNTRIELVFNQIEKLSGYSFIYEKNLLKNMKRLDVSLQNESLNNAMSIILKDQSLDYTIRNTFIVLSPKIIRQKSTVFTSPIIQFIKITGVVKDTTGTTIPGVSILNKNTGKKAATDSKGVFSIEANGGDILLFSSVGYVKQEIKMTGVTSLIIVLKEEKNQLEQVVVTALGIKKTTRALTYNVQEVKGEELIRVPDASFVNSLTGKVAGITINASSSGIGGSTRVVMRGTKSIAGNNNALYVVDGIPLPNLTSTQTGGLFDGNDGGDGISMINADDIESISVLTGPAAAALYGSSGANGVVVVNTKKGLKDRLRIDVSNSTSFYSPFVMPKFQNKYGSEAGSYFSNGPLLSTPSTYDPKDFFQTGTNIINNFSLSTGGERNQTYFSASTLNAKGIIGNNKLNRYNFSIRNTTSFLRDKLNLDLSVSYIKDNNQNMVAQGQYFNPLIPIYLFPRGDHIENYQVYERYDVDRGFKTQYWPYGDLGFQMQNPYWTINRNISANNRERYLMSASLNYNVLDWLKVTGRVKLDNTNLNGENIRYASTSGLFAGPSGFYGTSNGKTSQLYTDFIATADRTFRKDYHLTANLGASLVDYKSPVFGYAGNLNRVPNFFQANNIDQATALITQTNQKYQNQAIFATAQIGYQNRLFLDLTGRKEWSSMLSNTTQKSIFYPSVGVSGILSDWLNLSKSGLSYLKLRGSYSEVGNPPLPYQTTVTYPLTGSVPSTVSTAPFTTLQPERTKSVETGINARFLNDRIDLDITLYNSNTQNQIFNMPVSASTSYSSVYINGGKVNNKGIEAALAYHARFGALKWDPSFTFTLNRNKIIELLRPTIDPVTGLTFSTSEMNLNTNGTYKTMLTVGGTMGDIYASTIRRDANGYIYVNPSSDALQPNADVYEKLGSTNPDYTIAFRNNFTYKNWNLNFLIDGRVGGVGVSATQAIMDQFGVSKATADARDNGGVLVNGYKIGYENYYSVVAGGTTGILSQYVYSSTNFRLREASLSYSFPAKIFHNAIKGASVSVTGRNLFMFYNKAPYDPETTGSTGTFYQGIDYFKLPSLRSIGFNVKLQF